MDQEKIFKVAKWTTEHETTLKDLYKTFQDDTGDNKTSFVEYCAFMYDECKH